MSAGPPAAGPAEVLQMFHRGDFAAMEHAARALIASDPRHGFAWKALGAALSSQGRHQEGLQAKQSAVDVLPDDSEAHGNLGNALLAEGRMEEAVASFEAAVRTAPSDPAAWNTLARALALAGRFHDAESALRRVLLQQPGSADAHSNLGDLLRQQMRMPEAADMYRKAIALDPGLAEAHSNLGNTLADLGDVDAAEASYRKALEHLPRRAEIHSNLANLLKDQGRLGEAQAAYRQALALAPHLLGAHNNLLLAMNHDGAVTPEEALAEAKTLGRALQAATRAVPFTHAQPRRPGPLRAGLVSGDLRTHPVGYFLEGWLGALDASRVQLFAYATRQREDALTARIKPAFTAWRNLQGMHHEAAARLVREDGIDVLLDLAGHTAHNRLDVFAWRPAPVQASWLGYFATTGVREMDWVIADPASVSPVQHAHFSERVFYLPATRLCFAAPQDAPAVSALPALTRGHITFGCFQSLGKINDGVLNTWAAVLQSVPGARLRLQNAQLGDAGVRTRLAQRMRAAGLDPARVEMHGRMERTAYLAAHGEVDVLLDSFPYPGGTTTCEALWMGVPTLTLEGDRMLARQGAALLAAAGLPQWIARTPREYADKAAAFARDTGALARLRAQMRRRVAASALFDGPRFAADFTQAMETMARVASTGRAGR